LSERWRYKGDSVELDRQNTGTIKCVSGGNSAMMRATPAGILTMKPSPIVKRSIKVKGATTSVSLEDPFWNGMKEIAKRHDMTLSELADEIESNSQRGNLSSAIRLFVLDYYRHSQSLPIGQPEND
jgi:predicted DNA-binding ribbon-helix-helix protein